MIDRRGSRRSYAGLCVACLSGIIFVSSASAERKAVSDPIDPTEQVDPVLATEGIGLHHSLIHTVTTAEALHLDPQQQVLKTFLIRMRFWLPDGDRRVDRELRVSVAPGARMLQVDASTGRAAPEDLGKPRATVLADDHTIRISIPRRFLASNRSRAYRWSMTVSSNCKSSTPAAPPYAECGVPITDRVPDRGVVWHRP